MLRLLSYSHFFSRFCISCLYPISKISTFLTDTSFGRCQFSSISEKDDSDTGNEKDDHPSPAYLRSAFESGLGQEEYQNVVSNVVDLVNPSTVSPATGMMEKDSRMLIILVK